MMISRGSVRRGVLVGSAVAVLLLAATAALMFRGGGINPGRETNRQPPPASQGDSAAGARQPAGEGRVAEPPAPKPPSFDIVKVGPTGTAVIAGRAEPGSKVTVRDGDKVIGEVTADRRGEWVLVPDQPIGAGDRLLSLEASRQGGATLKSDETVALSIRPPAPGGQAGTALAVILPRDGEAAARVLQRPDEASPGSPSADKTNPLSMETAEYDPQGRVVLSGRATPGSTVQVYIGNEPVARVTADSSGAWSATSAQAVSPGDPELRLDQLASDGRVAHRVALPLAQAVAAQLASGQTYVVQRGNSLWQIARHSYGDGVRYLVIYSANLGQIRDPDRIYPGQVFKIPKS
jgi:nucleoid-associated protein YgaU